jgi:hypothetical protein
MKKLKTNVNNERRILRGRQEDQVTDRCFHCNYLRPTDYWFDYQALQKPPLGTEKDEGSEFASSASFK